MYIVGLTGGIGSGKSAVADSFAKLGAGIVDADVVARQVVKPGSSGLAQIIARFGDQVLTATAELDRQRLRELIFAQESERLWLNQLLHPLIRQQMLDQCAIQTTPYTLLVVPLLVENNLQQLCQRVLTVDVSPTTQLQRTCQRDNITPEQAQAIIKRQASRWQRLRAADEVINNNGDWPDTENQILQLHQLYLKFASQEKSKTSA